jgi:hypothetical protein
VTQVPPPVLGFNNNVRHRGRVFHIQTEDSGIKSPRIVTHLFADGGRIIKTARTAYADLVGRSDLSQVVRQMMKDQHKSMFSALRTGELDALLEASCGPLPEPAAVRSVAISSTANSSAKSAAVDAERVPVSLSSAAGAARAPRAIGNPNIYKMPPSVPPPSREALEMAVGTLEDLGKALPTPTSATPVEARVGRKSGAPPRKSRTPPAPPTANARPSTRHAGAPPAKASRSIFGDGVISEQSLDEVILSYLAEDLEGPSE